MSYKISIFRDYLVRTLVLGAFLMAPLFVFADHNTIHTIQQLQAQIQALREQLKSLQSQQQTQQQSVLPSAPTSISATPPVFDEDTSDDDIIQLNNLRIHSISGYEKPAIIYASYDFGTGCLKFKSLESLESSILPCPAAPSVLYPIRVDEETRLLLRNRQKAALRDFDVGDRINVYGFMDRDTRAIDALIVRNLDKPQIQSLIQLNNVEVNSAPSSPYAPATFTVVQKQNSPCFDYGVGGGARAETIPCPLGLEIKEQAEQRAAEAAPGSPSPGVSQLYYIPMPKKYLIEVTNETAILARDRTPLALKDIGIGDKLNIYGVQKYEAGIVITIKALTIRNLSKPVKVGTGTLWVTVTDAEVVCVRPTQTQDTSVPSATTVFPLPCGVIYNATIWLYDSNGSLVGTKTTANGIAIFENLRAGAYTAVASAPGYESAKHANVVINSGEMTSLSFNLSRIPQKITVYTKSDLQGVVGQYFQAVFLGDGGTPSYTWSVTGGSLPPGLELVSPPMPLSLMPCMIDPLTKETDCPGFKQTTIWLQGTPTAAGFYKFELTAKDQKGNTGSATFDVVISPSVSPSITVISPNGGEVWQIGSTQTIKWVTNNIKSQTGLLDIIRLRNSSGQEITLLTNTPNDGIEQVVVPSLPAGFYTLEIKTYSDILGYLVMDKSDAPFSIVAQPSVSDSFTVDKSKISSGEYVTFKFSAANATRFVFYLNCGKGISVGSSEGAQCNVERTDYFPSGYTVKLVNTVSTAQTAVARVSAYRDTVLLWTKELRVDVLPATFSSITVISPNGGETFTQGVNTNKISWSGGQCPETNKYCIAVSLWDAAKTKRYGWITGSGSPNSIAYWDAKGVFSLRGGGNSVAVSPGTYRVKVEDSVTSDWSDSSFGIVAPSAMNDAQQNMTASVLIAIQQQLDKIAEEIKKLQR